MHAAHSRIGVSRAASWQSDGSVESFTLRSGQRPLRAAIISPSATHATGQLLDLLEERLAGCFDIHCTQAVCSSIDDLGHLPGIDDFDCLHLAPLQAGLTTGAFGIVNRGKIITLNRFGRLRLQLQ